MKIKPITVKDKKGCDIELRSAEISDAEILIEYLKNTTKETPYLIQEPEEITFTVEQEQNFLKSKIESEKELMLLAFTDGKFVGSCSLMSMGNHKRYAHRCSIAIALYHEYCGRGIGKIMLETLLKTAKEIGYEQAELEVMSKNEKAKTLYESLGFKVYGTLPNNIKYKYGSYDDSYWMMKQL